MLSFYLGAAQVLLQIVMLIVREPQGPVAHHGVGAFYTHQHHYVQQVPLVLQQRAQQLVKVLGLHLEEQQTTA